MALLKDIVKPNERVKRVQVGASLDGGYRVDAITDHELVLIDGKGARKVLTLFDVGPLVQRRHTKTMDHSSFSAPAAAEN